MRKGIIGLVAVLLLLPVILAGCGGTGNGSENLMRSGSKEESKIPNDDPVQSTNVEITPDTGIITDTVVDVFREPATHSERVTQAIYNQPVKIIKQQEQWTEVKVVDGYSGWVKSKYVDRDTTSIIAEHYKLKLIITGKTKRVLSSPKDGFTLKETVMGTELYSFNKADEWYEVALPGNRTGWIEQGGTIEVPVGRQIPKTTAGDFVMTADKLKGTKYLWGGVSSWGIDCSGLTYICARINGIELPRDCDQQFNTGEAVSGGTDNMKPGDLLYFSTKEDLKDISHVGIYLGDKKFIHASNSRGAVMTSSIEEDYFKKRLVGVKRIF